MTNRYYIIDVWQEDDIWTWEGEVKNEAEALELARKNLNKDWFCDFPNWEELAEDMDGTAIRCLDAKEQRAKSEALAMLEILRECKEITWSYGATGLSEDISNVLTRIDGAAK